MRRVRDVVKTLGEILAFDNRWPLLADSLIGPKGLRIYRLDGIEAVADHKTGDHLGGIRTVFATNEYRRLLRQIPVQDIRTVLDLGAHIGTFILLARTLGAPLNHPVCVEPDSRSREKLRFNLQHNGITAEIFAGAVSDNAGTVHLHKGLTSTGSSLLSDFPNLCGETIEVEAVTLDKLVDRYFQEQTVDLCKVDIEGAEFDVVLGEHSRALDRCRYLICEIHPTPPHKSVQLVESLRRRGFAMHPVTSGRYADTASFTALFRNEKLDRAATWNCMQGANNG